MLILHHHHKFEDKINLFTIKTEFMEIPVPTVTWSYKTMKRRDDGTSPMQTVVLCNDHSDEGCDGLNLKIYSVICTAMTDAQNSLSPHIPILYRIPRTQNTPRILQMEFYSSARDKMIHFPEIFEVQDRSS